MLHQGVAGIAELVTVPGLINLDFADIKAVMEQAGSALMGIGVGKGETRAIDAARAAIGSPLLETSIDGAKGVLFNVTGGKSLSMHEVDEAAKYITKSVDPDAKIIFGAVIDEKMEDEVKITVVATGFDEGSRRKPVDSVAPAMPMEETKEEQGSVTRKPMFSTKSLEEPAKQDEQDELDIPAFIRKKMK